MSALRSALHATLNSPRLLAVAAAIAIALGETTSRIGLALLGHPALAVLFPPVFAVVGFGLAAPTVRAALPDDVPTPRDDAPPPTTLVAAAVLGHLAALALGTAGFLLLDTPIRAVLYWLGYGDALGIPVQVGGGILGVVVGTLLAWTLPGVAVGRLIGGASPLRAAESALVAPVRAPRRVAGALGAHLAFGGLLGLSVVTAAGAARSTGSGVVALAVGGGLAALVSAFALALLAARYVAGGVAAPDHRPTPRRLALVALLLTGLVVGAGGVRTTERRPTAEPAALPDDPDGAYATALSNTRRADHRYRVAVHDDDGNGEPFVVERALDRTDRQYRQRALGEAQGSDLYAGAGTGSPPIRAFDRVALGRRTVGDERSVRASPDYLYWTDGYRWDGEGGLQPPARTVEGWTVVDRSDDRLVLELVGARPVFEATQGSAPDRVTNVSAARIRTTIDRGSRTVERIEVRFDATVTAGETTDRIRLRIDHEFTVGVDVERPAALGAPRPGELVWKLLVY